MKKEPVVHPVGVAGVLLIVAPHPRILRNPRSILPISPPSGKLAILGQDTPQLGV